MTLMPTSQTSVLHEIAHGKPISLRTRQLYRRRLQNRVQRLIHRAFRDEQKKSGLTQKELAERIDKDKSKVNQWLSVSSNLTLETISDLLLGLGVDLDNLSITPIADLIHEADQKTANDKIHFDFDNVPNSLNNRPESKPPWVQAVLVAVMQGRPSAARLPEPTSGAAISKTAEVIQQQYPLEPANSLAFADYPKRKISESEHLLKGWE
jgi:transcriptional regulator with XRE-family HTH domain